MERTKQPKVSRQTKVTKPDIADLNVEEVFYKPYAGYDFGVLELKFTGNISIKDVNSLRRAACKNVLCWGFRKEDMAVDKKTNLVANDYDMIRSQLYNLPVFQPSDYDTIDPEIVGKDLRIEVFIKVGEGVENITTDLPGVEVFIGDNSTPVKMFSDKYPITLIEKRKQEILECSLKASAGYGYQSTCYNCAIINYHKQVNDGEYILGVGGSEVVPCHEMVARACTYIIDKCNKLKVEIKEIEMKSNNGEYEFDFEGETHTFIQPLNYELQSHPDVISCGCYQPDLAENRMIIKAAFSNENINPQEVIIAVCNIIIAKYSRIQTLVRELKKKHQK